MAQRVFLLIFAAAMVCAINAVQPNASCTAPGLMCRNCDELAVCVATGAGTLKQWTLSRCPTGSCRNGRCVPGAACNYRPFACSESGAFPDPYDCTKFHLCDENLTLSTVECGGSAYDSVRNYCSFAIKGNLDCIDGPVPKCERNLQIGALPRNPNIYYICTEDYNTVAANLFKCPPSSSFNATSFECTPNKTV